MDESLRTLSLQHEFRFQNVRFHILDPMSVYCNVMVLCCGAKNGHAEGTFPSLHRSEACNFLCCLRQIEVKLRSIECECMA